jgi:hypothetical protein
MKNLEATLQGESRTYRAEILERLPNVCQGESGRKCGERHPNNLADLIQHNISEQYVDGLRRKLSWH